jgi:hypothetical protein
MIYCLVLPRGGEGGVIGERPGKIIQRSAYRQSGVKCPKNGVVFPQLYRGIGFSWDQATTGALVPGTERSILYSLQAERRTALANVKWEAIDHLHRGIDTGWVLIRHHITLEHAYGYIAGAIDLMDDEHVGPMLVQTDVDLFTVVHCDARKGCQDCLLACITPASDAEFGILDWIKVIDADGQEHGDEVMHPL